jgi:UPF0716 protein FxsA
MYIRAGILLLLPLADAALLLQLGRLLGSWLWIWTGCGALIGLVLIRGARDSMRRQWAGRTGGARLQALLDNCRTVLAGLLFLWPGVLSDLAAVTLLLTAPPATVGANWEHPLALNGRRQSFGDSRVVQTQA